MHISYDEFEKVMMSAFEVFATWDDEYEKLQVCAITATVQTIKLTLYCLF